MNGEPLTTREVDIMRMAIKERLDTLIADTKEIKLHVNGLGVRVSKLEQFKVKMMFGVWITSATVSLLITMLGLMFKFDVLMFNL